MSMSPSEMTLLVTIQSQEDRRGGSCPWVPWVLYVLSVPSVTSHAHPAVTETLPLLKKKPRITSPDAQSWTSRTRYYLFWEELDPADTPLSQSGWAGG